MKDVYVPRGQSVNFSAILLFVVNHNLAISSKVFALLAHMVKQTIPDFICYPELWNNNGNHVKDSKLQLLHKKIIEAAITVQLVSRNQCRREQPKRGGTSRKWGGR